MGVIFDIQRFCIHDGPGIRTTVFLKGCPLHCIWCSNPESQQAGPQLMFSKDRCMACGACVSVCPQHQPPSCETYQPDLCCLCGKCEAVCPKTAIVQKGRSLSAAELVEEVLKDRTVFQSTCGGVTFSGESPSRNRSFCMSASPYASRRGWIPALRPRAMRPGKPLLLVPRTSITFCAM